MRHEGETTNDLDLDERLLESDKDKLRTPVVNPASSVLETETTTREILVMQDSICHNSSTLMVRETTDRMHVFTTLAARKFYPAVSDLQEHITSQQQTTATGSAIDRDIQARKEGAHMDDDLLMLEISGKMLWLQTITVLLPMIKNDLLRINIRSCF